MAEQPSTSDENNPEDQYKKGVLYGMQRNYDRAADWYAAAARQGYVPAIVALGELYENGHGVEENWPIAAYLYNSAVERDKDNAEANYKLGRLYEMGKGVVKNNVKAFEYIKKSADKGYPAALYTLGVAYIFGNFGVERDINKAKAILGKASDLGNQDAMSYLDNIEAKKKAENHSVEEGGYKKRKSNRKHPSKHNRIRARKHKWSLKYKRSINCKHPKGFSQRQHCKYGRKTMRKLTRKK